MDDAELRRPSLGRLRRPADAARRRRARNGWVLRKARAGGEHRSQRARLARAQRRGRAGPERRRRRAGRARDHVRRRGRAPLGGVDRRRRAARHARSSARRGWRSRRASPGMGAAIDELGIDLTTANARPNAGLRTVGRVNDLAYGNVDSRLERTLTTLEEGTLRGYRADLNGAPGGGRARAAPRGGLRRLVRRHRPAGATARPRDPGDALRPRRRPPPRPDDDHAPGHRAGRAPLPAARPRDGSARWSCGSTGDEASTRRSRTSTTARAAGSRRRSTTRAASRAPTAATAPSTTRSRSRSSSRHRTGDIILMRRGFEPRRGHWSLPGGFVDLGETVETAAAREVMRGTEPSGGDHAARGRLFACRGSYGGCGLCGRRTGHPLHCRRRPSRCGRLRRSTSHGRT